MTGYIIRRSLSLLFVMFVVSVLVFLLMSAIPGGPFSMGERGYTEDAMANVLAKYGLEIEPFGQNTFVISAVPTLLTGRPMRPLVAELVEKIARIDVDTGHDGPCKHSGCRGCRL